jgi:hypothetical protein
MLAGHSSRVFSVDMHVSRAMRMGLMAICQAPDAASTLRVQRVQRVQAEVFAGTSLGSH